MEEQMFPIRRLGLWRGRSCASPGQPFLLALAPVSSVLKPLRVLGGSWGTADLLPHPPETLILTS